MKANMIREQLPIASPALARILELASWAPSGDNTQPWRFEIRDDRHVVIHGFDTRSHCVYDLDGRPSQVAIGCLIETMAIAASADGWRLAAVRRAGCSDGTPTFDTRFPEHPSIAPDDLVQAVRSRSVQRRPMHLRPLTPVEKAALAASVGNAHRIVWLEGLGARRRTASLMFRSAKIRLTMPEAYRVHRDVIEWKARFSVDRVPDQALGVDAATLRLMRFAMKSWSRVDFLNRFFAGTWAPRLQMDWLPGLACAAHFVLAAQHAPVSIDDHVAAGRAVQRFWLAATRLGLVLQPELTPLIFARYAAQDLRFSQTRGIDEQARRIASRLDALVGTSTARQAVFMGRIGAGPQATARSHRLPMARLVQVSALNSSDR